MKKASSAVRSDMVRRKMAALHVADVLVETARAGAGMASEQTADLSFLERTGFLNQLPNWREIGSDEISKVN